MLLMEKMLPHIGFVQPSSFHMLSQLARPMPVSLGQQMASLPGLGPLAGTHPLKLCSPLAGRDGPQHPLAFSVLGRGGASFLDSGAEHGSSVPGGLASPYDRDDDKGESRGGEGGFKLGVEIRHSKRTQIKLNSRYHRSLEMK